MTTVLSDSLRSLLREECKSLLSTFIYYNTNLMWKLHIPSSECQDVIGLVKMLSNHLSMKLESPITDRNIVSNVYDDGSFELTCGHKFEPRNLFIGRTKGYEHICPTCEMERAYTESPIPIHDIYNEICENFQHRSEVMSMIDDNFDDIIERWFIYGSYPSSLNIQFEKIRGIGKIRKRRINSTIDNVVSKYSIQKEFPNNDISLGIADLSVSYKMIGEEEGIYFSLCTDASVTVYRMKAIERMVLERIDDNVKNMKADFVTMVEIHKNKQHFRDIISYEGHCEPFECPISQDECTYMFKLTCGHKFSDRIVPWLLQKKRCPFRC